MSDAARRRPSAIRELIVVTLAVASLPAGGWLALAVAGWLWSH